MNGDSFKEIAAGVLIGGVMGAITSGESATVQIGSLLANIGVNSIKATTTVTSTLISVRWVKL